MAKESQVPYLSSKLLTPNLQDTDFDGHFDYHSVIGKLNYLEKSTRPELAYAVHQCARYCSAPKCSHGEAVKRIGRYLLGTKDKGLILKPTKESFDCWVDASHAGKCNKMRECENTAINAHFPHQVHADQTTHQSYFIASYNLYVFAVQTIRIYMGP